MEITVPALLETGVGKVVRSLKHKGGRVAELAKKLVTRWKKVVIEYEPPLLDVGEAVDSELNNIGSDGHGGRDGSNEPLMITTASPSVSSPIMSSPVPTQSQPSTDTSLVSSTVIAEPESSTSNNNAALECSRVSSYRPVESFILNLL